MNPLEDFEKALLVLHLSEGKKLGPAWGITRKDKQEALIAHLCFEGDSARTTAALEECARRGFADTSSYSKS